MKPHRTLRQELVNPKDKVSNLDKAGVVYQINCQDCDACYIGHTSKNLRDRVKQHRTAIDKGKSEDSAVAEHAWTAHHTIDWNNVQVLDQDSDDKHRQIKECFLIRSRSPHANCDLGLEITSAYSIIRGSSRTAEGSTESRLGDITLLYIKSSEEEHGPQRARKLSLLRLVTIGVKRN